MSALERTERWLASRIGGAPAPLAAEVAVLVREAASRPVPAWGGGDVADLLAVAGVAALVEVAAGSGQREGALRLLAADAALTCAFEAAAELGGDVAALCAAVGPSGALGRAVEAAARGDRAPDAPAPGVGAP